MDLLRKYIKPKPLELIIIPIVYIAFMVLFKWRLVPQLDAVLFVVGGIIGIFLLDAAEVFFDLHPSPFRTVVFLGGFIVLVIFMVTSSANLMAGGLVLSMYLTLILMMYAEWHLRGNISSWFRLVSGVPTVQFQKWLFGAFVAIFVFVSFLYGING